MKNDNIPEFLTQERINELAQNDARKLVEICEKHYREQIETTCDEILSNKKNKIVLLAGPSGSGKTTTARKLKEKIISKGINAVTISLDDFFKNREDLNLFYKTLVETTYFTFSSEDIYSFFGRNVSKIHTFSKGEIVSDLRNYRKI